MNIDQDRLLLILKTLQNDLGDGLVASEIWTASDGLPLVNAQEYNSNPKVAPLFNEVTRKLSKTLSESDYPGLGNYYFINLDNNLLAVVLNVDNYQQFILIDIKKISIGLLISVALPNLLNMLAGEAKVEKPNTPEGSESPTALRENNTSQQRTGLREVLNALASGIYYTDKT